MSTSNSSRSYWDSVGNRIIRFVNLLHPESSPIIEDSRPSIVKPGMHHRNDENRGRKRTDKVGHVVETRSRTRASFSSPNASAKSASNTPSPAINGFHDCEESISDKSFAVPTISPRKLKELRELNESSTWKDPSVGKHPRPTRRSLTSQRTSPRMPALKAAPQSSTPNIFPGRPSTRSQVKQNGFGTNGITLHFPQPSPSSALQLNGVQKRRTSLRLEHHHEPVAKKQRVINKLKLKIPNRISKIKKKPIKRQKFKPYRTKKVLAFETSDIDDPETFDSLESLQQRCMRRKIPIKRSKAKNTLKMKIKKRPRTSDSAFSIVPEILEKTKVNENKALKAVLPIMAFNEKKLHRISLAERMYMKRSLRLKRPSDANFLLPFPRSRLQHNPKFKIATKRIKLPPLKNGIKWLALLTPCQRSCNCMRFQTKRVKWNSNKMPKAKHVNALKIDDVCSCCKHSLWVHRRKYDLEDRRKRYTVIRDIIITQKMINFETNKENLRVLFILLKDLISIIVENRALPKECYPFKGSLIHDLSIRRHVQAYMQSKEARRLGFLNRHAQDLLQTLEEFVFPPPDKIEKYSYTFRFKKYSRTIVEKTFLTWYRHFYLRWLVFCRLPYYLNCLPKFETCNIMSFQFVELFGEAISLKLEEQYEETRDPAVKVVAVMFRRLRVFSRNIVTISKRNVKRLTLKGCGNNVLDSDYDESLPSTPDAIETRSTPALDAILQEDSGPFTYIRHFEDEAEPLEVTCPLPFAKYFWTLAKNKKYKLFLNSVNGAKREGSLTFRHDPSSLTDFREISRDIIKRTRVSRWRSNCDRERAAGKIEMLVLRNIKSTTCPKQNDFLMQFISVIHRQLPKMPKHYIIRLVMDGKHRSMILLKYLNRGSSPGWAVLGGICFRPFKTQSFSEIVFVAVHADHQVRGYGGYLMDQLKRYHVEHLGFPHLLTFADKNAIGYFQKQGFSKDIGLSRENYHRYIKEYEGATLMYCQSRLCNTPEDELYWAYKLKKHLRNLYFVLCPEWKQTFEGLENKFLKWDLLPMKVDRFEQVDNYGFGLFCDDIGLLQLFWKRQYELIELSGGPSEEEEFFSDDEYFGRENPTGEISDDDEEGYSLDDELATPEWKEPDDDYDPEEENSTQMMFMLVEAICRCPYSWPFHYPVDEYDAPTYSEDLNQAMTLEIIEDRLDWGYYVHERMLFLDFARIFINCYAFNEQQDGPYYHACYRLHQYFNGISLQIFGDRIAPYLLPIAEASSFRKPNQKADQVVFDPLRPYWYPVRIILPPPPPTPKSKKTPKKKLSKTRSKSIGSTKKRTKSETPAREKTPQRKPSFSTTKKVQTKLVFNQSNAAGYHLEFLDETPPEKRTTRAAARTSTTPNTPNNARRRRR